MIRPLYALRRTPPEPAAQLDIIRAQVDALQVALQAAREENARLRMRFAEVQAALAARPDLAQQARDHQTLLGYEDRLAWCRDQHGGNGGNP